MPFGDEDFVGSWLRRRTANRLEVPEGFRNLGDEEEDYTVYEDVPEPESMKALRGTGFDSNPVTAWLANNPAPPERTPF